GFALEFAEETGAVLIHPFDHVDIITGQATIGAEILEQVPDVRTILVPLGGGGLAAGVALAKLTRPDLKVIGVQADSAAAYPGSLDSGAPRHLQMGPTMADGIAVAQPGQIPFDIVREHVDEVI